VDEERKMSAVKPKTATEPEGLVGFLGHTYGDDPEGIEKKMIRFQFKIIRKVDATRYAVQYFSCWDGCPTNVGVMSEADLLGPDVRLYASQELWNDAFARALEQRERWRRRSEARQDG